MVDQAEFDTIQNKLKEALDYKYALEESSILAITDEKGIIKFANDNFCKISKYTREELIGQDHRIVNSKSHPKTFFANLWQTIVSGKIWRGEIKNRAKDGSTYWVDTTIVPFLNADHKPYQYVAIRSDITHRKLLEEQNSLFACIINSTNDAVLSTNLEGIILSWNLGAETLYGHTFHEIKGKNVSAIIPDENLNEENIIFEKIKKGEIVRNYETLRCNKNGDKLYVSLTVSPIRNLDGVIIGASKIARDITEKKEIEKRLEKNEKLFRTLIENSNDVVSLMDEQFKVIYRSPSAFKITGWADVEVLNKSGVDKIHPEDLNIAKVLIANLFESPGVIFNTKFRNKHKLGHYIWIEGTVINLLNDENVKAIVFNFRDISKRIEDKILLEKSEKIYKTIASSIPDSAICLLDMEYRYFLIEGDIVEKLGYSKELLLNNKAEEVIPKEVFNEVKNDLDLVKSGESLVRETNRNGLDILTKFIPLKDLNGSVYSIMTMTIDITLLKVAQREVVKLNLELEQKVIQRTEQLYEANKELESFSYSVSHDLRTPLRAVNGYAKMLEEDYFHLFDDEGKRLLNVVQDNAHKMGILIDELLNFSRLGRKELNKTFIDMTAIVDGCIKEFNSLPDFNANIVLNQLATVKCDNNLMRQVWQNLLSNAIKYSSKVNSPLIEINSEEKNNYIEFSIKDNGAGFDMKFYNKLFGVFQRLHRTEEFEGTGVGLALSQRIVNKHGGKIWAESELGKGSIFYFSLPIDNN